jgi:superoxide reductase
MARMGELFQTADWKSENHVPVVECPDAVKADEIHGLWESSKAIKLK